MRTRPIFTFLFVTLVVLTTILAAIGWIRYENYQYLPVLTVQGFVNFLEVVYRTIRVFTFSDIYSEGVAGAEPLNRELQIARFLGAILTAAGVIRVTFAVFSNNWERLRAQKRRRHAVVIGDSPIARRFAELWITHARSKVTHHTSHAEDDWDGVLTLPRPEDAGPDHYLKSVNGARRVVVAEADDARTIALVVGLARRLSEGRSAGDATIHAVLNNPEVAGRLPGDTALVRALSVPANRARATLAAYPAVVLSPAGGPTHVVICGFGDKGQALASEVLNACVLSETAPPKITVIGEDASTAVDAFLFRRPGLREAGTPIAAIDAGPQRFTQPALTALRAAHAEAPICAVYVTEDAATWPLADAFAMDRIILREGIFGATIFVSAAAAEGVLEPGVEVSEKDRGQLNRMIAFGAIDDMLIASGVLDKDPDAAAKEIHAAYRNAATNRPADRPWNALAETYRTANRRVLAHIPAKLTLAGFDLSNWEATPDALPTLKPGERLYRNATELMQLAAAEHARWMMERCLDGWRHGEQRDDVRKIHNNLVPFSQLAAEFKVFDIQSVVTLSTLLKPHHNGISRPEGAAPPVEKGEDRAFLEANAPDVARALDQTSP